MLKKEQDLIKKLNAKNDSIKSGDMDQVSLMDLVYQPVVAKTGCTPYEINGKIIAVFGLVAFVALLLAMF